eukprot:3536900-Prymnesium_polylepis.1
MRRRDGHAFGARIALASGQLFFRRSSRQGGAVSRRMSQDARLHGQIARARPHGRNGTRSGLAGTLPASRLSRRRVLDDEIGADNRAARRQNARSSGP